MNLNQKFSSWTWTVTWTWVGSGSVQAPELQFKFTNHPELEPNVKFYQCLISKNTNNAYKIVEIRDHRWAREGSDRAPRSNLQIYGIWLQNYGIFMAKIFQIMAKIMACHFSPFNPLKIILNSFIYISIAIFFCSAVKKKIAGLHFAHKIAPQGKFCLKIAPQAKISFKNSPERENFVQK